MTHPFDRFDPYFQGREKALQAYEAAKTKALGDSPDEETELRWLATEQAASSHVSAGAAMAFRRRGRWLPADGTSTYINTAYLVYDLQDIAPELLIDSAAKLSSRSCLRGNGLWALFGGLDWDEHKEAKSDTQFFEVRRMGRLVQKKAGKVGKQGRVNIKAHKTVAKAEADFAKLCAKAEADFGAAPVDVHASDENLNEQLASALRAGDIGVVQKLLARGASPTALVPREAGEPQRPLQMATSTLAFQLLLEAGAKMSDEANAPVPPVFLFDARKVALSIASGATVDPTMLDTATPVAEDKVDRLKFWDLLGIDFDVPCSRSHVMKGKKKIPTEGLSLSEIAEACGSEQVAAYLQSR